MISRLVRVNSRDTEVVLTALAKYNAWLIKETKGTDALKWSEEPKIIQRLFKKFINTRDKIDEGIGQ